MCLDIYYVNEHTVIASYSSSGTLSLLQRDMGNGKSVTGWSMTASGSSSRQYTKYTNPGMPVTYTNNKKIFPENNDTTIAEDWNSAETTNLYDTYKYGTSTSADGVMWFKQENYRSHGYWGDARETSAEAFIDRYGFKHMYLGYYSPTDESVGITNCDKSDAWKTIAAAGYTESEGGIAGNLEWSLEDVDSLYELYENQTGAVSINNVLWYYTDNDYSDSTVWGERELGEYWIDENGYKHIYLGSGLVSYNESAIPEPASILLLVSGLIMLVRKRQGKRLVGFKLFCRKHE